MFCMKFMNIEYYLYFLVFKSNSLGCLPLYEYSYYTKSKVCKSYSTYMINVKHNID